MKINKQKLVNESGSKIVKAAHPMQTAFTKQSNNLNEITTKYFLKQ